MRFGFATIDAPLARACATALVAFVAALSAPANASASKAAQAVLAVEARWLAAIARRDPVALGAVLAPGFAHVDYRGRLHYRDEELRAVRAPKPYAQQLGDQTVDFAGNVAIVRGVNTVSRRGRTIVRLRYTDLFERMGGGWRAIGAQETMIAPVSAPAHR